MAYATDSIVKTNQKQNLRSQLKVRKQVRGYIVNSWLSLTCQHWVLHACVCSNIIMAR